MTAKLIIDDDIEITIDGDKIVNIVIEGTHDMDGFDEFIAELTRKEVDELDDWTQEDFEDPEKVCDYLAKKKKEKPKGCRHMILEKKENEANTLGEMFKCLGCDQDMIRIDGKDFTWTSNVADDEGWE